MEARRPSIEVNVFPTMTPAGRHAGPAASHNSLASWIDTAPPSERPYKKSFVTSTGRVKSHAQAARASRMIPSSLILAVCELPYPR